MSCLIVPLKEIMCIPLTFAGHTIHKNQDKRGFLYVKMDGNTA